MTGSDAIRWPTGMSPRECPVHARNELVIAAPPARVWAALVNAAGWPAYYANARDVQLDGGAGELALGMRFSFITFGVRVRCAVEELEPERRLAWRGRGPGMTAYHGWVITPRDGGSHVVTEETQRGAVPSPAAYNWDVITVRTRRLELVAANAELARAAVDDRARFAELLSARVPERWPPELFAEDERRFAERLEGDPALEGWLPWYLVRADGAPALIGCAGFGGPPDEHGAVQLGYSLLDAQRGHGFATEAVGGLIDWAFEDPRTRAIVAQTYERLPASVRVLEKNGLTLCDRGPEPGLLTFALRRPPR